MMKTNTSAIILSAFSFFLANFLNSYFTKTFLPFLMTMPL